MTIRNTTTSTPTFATSGVEFSATDVVSTVKRANVLFNANGQPMTYREIEQALYNGELNPSNFYRVVLAYIVNGTAKGIKLTTNRVQLAGQRGEDNSLKGAAKDAHYFIKNQAKLGKDSTIHGTITIGAAKGGVHFGYNLTDSTFKPCIAALSSTYDKDVEAHAEVMGLLNNAHGLELQVYYRPTPDFTAWCKCMAAMTAQSA